jgi:murein hydrolase activator
MIKIKNTVVLITSLFIFPLVYGEQTAVTSQQKELVELRDEIKKFEQRLTQQKVKETTMLDYLAGLDREIDLTVNYLSKLRDDLTQNEQQLVQYQSESEIMEKQINILKDRLRKRVVYFYKHGEKNDYELLLTRTSLSQIMVWLRYRKMIMDNDRRTIQTLKAKQSQLLYLQTLLASGIKERQIKLSAKQQEDRRLKESRQKRMENLKSIRKDKTLLEAQLKTVKQAERNIIGLISQAEEERLTRHVQNNEAQIDVAKPLKRDHRFSELKGRMRWPVRGEIISKFGRQKHPELNTITENLGIEIKAPLGSPVMSVDDGQVQTITWQRGRGNIIIVSHDDGYYTVYTNLSEISVKSSENVRQGQIIGAVGDSGFSESPLLHFQIWKNTVNLNPEDWLN